MPSKASKAKTKKSYPTKMVEFGPKSLKQEMFLNTEADICVFGGGAGSGKSFLGIMDLLKHANDPKFNGVVVRQVTPQIRGPGGVFEKAKNMYRDVFGDAVRIRERDLEIIYPSGGKVSFRHCQAAKDKYNFQGWEISVALIDEAQQLGYEEVVYIMSRLRTEAKMKSYMRMTCNPDKNSWLREWVDWYLYPEGHEEAGIPDPDKCGVLRYFVIQDNTPIWGDSKEELYQKFGASAKPLSFTFISANVYDNPVMMENQPDYVAWLEGLPRVEKRRLLYGDWNATESASGFWKKEWVTVLNDAPKGPRRKVRAWDIAATLPSESNPDVDWSAGVLMSKNTEQGTFCVEDVIRFQDRFAGVEQRIIATAELDGPSVTIIIPCDPGAAAKMYANDLARKLADKGFTVRLKRPDKAKEVRFGPFATVSENGFVSICKGPWFKDYVDELESFTGDGKGHDDQVDATSDAFWALKSSFNIPTFNMPDLTIPNPYNV